jgi:hypothetical protein
MRGCRYLAALNYVAQFLVPADKDLPNEQRARLRQCFADFAQLYIAYRAISEGSKKANAGRAISPEQEAADQAKVLAACAEYRATHTTWSQKQAVPWIARRTGIALRRVRRYLARREATK